MGNDGGSIPTRRELVKEAARNPTTTELKETQKEHLAHRWSTCPLSHKPLRRPVVSDCAGLLYNKDAVLQCLLSAEVSSLNKEDCDKLLQGRIKSLKDVVEVLFEEAGQLGDKERWLCPVTSKELGPTVKAVYLVPCGHAFSQEAIKEMKTDQCIQCNQSYKPENIVTLFPATEDEKTILQRRIDHLSEKGFTHSLKKAPGSSKKRKANKIAEEQEQPQKSDDTPQGTSVDGSKPPQTSRSQTSTPVPASRTTTPKPSSNGIKNAATANLTARVLEEENERKKRQRLINGENENLKSLFTKKGDEKRKNGDFMTRGYSIPANARYD